LCELIIMSDKIKIITHIEGVEIQMKGEFTTVIEKRGKWYIGYIEEISGVNTQGETLEEVNENLKEALALIIEANRELTRKYVQSPDAIRGTIAIEM
jgi:predicted RNase H-like HicB family nuclease